MADDVLINPHAFQSDQTSVAEYFTVFSSMSNQNFDSFGNLSSPIQASAIHPGGLAAYQLSAQSPRTTPSRQNQNTASVLPPNHVLMPSGQSKENNMLQYDEFLCFNSGTIIPDFAFPDTDDKDEPIPSYATSSSDSGIDHPPYQVVSNNRCSKNSSLLACPFYKRDPSKHQDCLKYELRRVKDVKQHIYRKHMKAEICPPCQRGILMKGSRHRIGGIACKCERNSRLCGITTETRSELRRDNRRGRTIERQWSNMWKILFPHLDTPQSCYLGNYFEEVLPQIRAFWHERGDGILSTVLENSPNGHGDFATLSQAMDKVFDLFASEMSDRPANQIGRPSETSAKSSTPIQLSTTAQQVGEGSDGGNTTFKDFDWVLRQLNEDSFDVDISGMEPSDWM